MLFNLLLVEFVDEGLIAFAQVLEADAHSPLLDFEVPADVLGYHLANHHDLSVWRDDLDSQFEFGPDFGRPLGRHEDPASREIAHENASHLPKVLESNYERGGNTWRGPLAAGVLIIDRSENAVELFAQGLPTLPLSGRQT